MLLTIVSFILLLLVLVLVHEWGHFFAARRLGVQVEEFGFGFPPRAVGWQKISGAKLEKVGEVEQVEIDVSEKIAAETEVVTEIITDKVREVDRLVPYHRWRKVDKKSSSGPDGLSNGTIYSLNWLPLGGFVRLKGEEGTDKTPGSFAAQKPWRRALIIGAGVVMNVVFAFIVLSFGFAVGFPAAANPEYGSALKNVRLQVVEVLPNSPASQAGLVVGDNIISIDGKVFTSQTDLQSYLNQGSIHPVSIELERQGKLAALSITPTKLAAAQDRVALGVWFYPMGTVQYPWYQAIWQGARETVLLIGAIVGAFADLFKNLIIHQQVPTDVAGPVGIAVITGQVVHEGWLYVLQFAALLSLNLAIINVLPLPALDGGRLLFIAIEKIRRRPNNEKIEAMVHRIGFALLMLLVLLVTYRDIVRLGGNLFGGTGQ